MAPVVIYAAIIAPNALHRIALRDSFKMNIACYLNGAFPCRTGEWEWRRRARGNPEAKGGCVLRRISPGAAPLRGRIEDSGMAAFCLAATVCWL
jgi:hypothetical protein